MDPGIKAAAPWKVDDGLWLELLKEDDASCCRELWFEFIEFCLISRFW